VFQVDRVIIFPTLGNIAALLTALCWTLSSVFFTTPSKVVGAVAVNRIRLVFATLLLLVAHLAMTGQVFPQQVEPYRWFWLGISGLVGLILGDTLLFKSYPLIGTRLAILVMALVPVISTLGALVFLGEVPALLTTIGILLCVGGIIAVVAERQNGGETVSHHEKRQFIFGLLYALGGAIGQAAGLVLAKKGLEGNFPSISATLIRMVSAMTAMWLVTIFTGQAIPTLKKVFCDVKTVRNIAAGSFVGPFIGVWLSQIAIQTTYVGIASTLMAMTPIFMLPISKWYFREKISSRAFIGTVIALAGVAIIFM
jgi:drug/metabolite transporter (DMT)-like permease